MFHDRARIHVQAGRGGDGALSFRREKHVPKGGPDGGDGGPGGDVVLVADADLRDLSSLGARHWFAAGKGGSGGGGGKHGASGGKNELRVPVGTRSSTPTHSSWPTSPRRRACRASERGRGRSRRQGLRDADAPGAALRRDGHAGRRGRLELRLKLIADAALAGPAERGQVVAARARSRTPSRRWPTTRSRPCAPVLGTVDSDERPARGRRRSRPDRRRERGYRARPRVPRAPGARAAARSPDRRRRR